MKTYKNTAQAGFTLVELSIVIVIIGFLVAGIAAGANLVKQAQLRSVISDLQSFQVGYNGFIGRFNAVPGDFASASSYWTGATCATTAATDCNGNGNGIVNPGATVTLDEVAKAWKQMQLAGLVGAGIAVLPAAGAAVALVPGINTPNSKFTGVGYTIAGTTDIQRLGAAVSIGFGNNSTNYLYIGKASATPANLIAGALTAEQAYNVDVKLDDGVASGANFLGFNTGIVRTVRGNTNTTLKCTLTTDIPSTATSYAVVETETACLLAMALN